MLKGTSEIDEFVYVWWGQNVELRSNIWLPPQSSAFHDPISHYHRVWRLWPYTFSSCCLVTWKEQRVEWGGQEGTCNRNSLVTSGPNYNMYKVWKSLLLLLWQISLQIKNQWLFLAVTGSLGCRETAILKSGEMGAFRDIQSWSFLSAKNRSSWSHKLVVVVFSCWVMSDSFATPWIVTCQALLSMGFSRQEY